MINVKKILRDTGCSGIIVKRCMVPEEACSNIFETCILADGSRVETEIVTIHIDTPYLSGTFKAWCLDSPMYDLILGNVEGVRKPHDPDPEWQPMLETHAVTRQQKIQEKLPYRKLQVPEIIKDTITPENLKCAQQEDTNLDKIRSFLGHKLYVPGNKPNISWIKKNGIIYREFKNDNDVKLQLVVPKKLRNDVMKLAHESILSGHLATRRSLDRVLSEFYWPGVNGDGTILLIDIVNVL